MLLSLVVRTSHPPVRLPEPTAPLPHPQIHPNSFVFKPLRTLSATTQNPFLSFHRLTHSAKPFSSTLHVSITSTLFVEIPGVASPSACPEQSLQRQPASPAPSIRAILVPLARLIPLESILTRIADSIFFRMNTCEKNTGGGAASRPRLHGSFRPSRFIARPTEFLSPPLATARPALSSSPHKSDA